MTRGFNQVITRDHNLRLLVSAEERKMIQDIADDRGLTVSATIRQLIRERWIKKFRGSPQKKTR